MFHISAGNHLELCLLTEAHSRPLFDLINENRDYLREWLAWVDSTRTLEDVRRLIRFGLRQHARSDGMNAGLWYHDALVGVISYNYIDSARCQTEIGYWLGAAYQGRGLMTAACRAMITYAFAGLGLERVEIHCATHNLKSRAIPERLGFTLEQAQASSFNWFSDHYTPAVIYSLSADQWDTGEAAHGRENRRCRQL